jgi:C4-dicarboxylate transporter DctM subunit
MTSIDIGIIISLAMTGMVILGMWVAFAAGLAGLSGLVWIFWPKNPMIQMHSFGH